MKRFIDCYKDEDVATQYNAGRVRKYGDEYIVAYETFGAAETFSIGQPVYDKDGNLMGYLGIGLFRHLDFVSEGVRIPTEHWRICLPTKDCVEGKAVYTYWQNQKRSAEKTENHGHKEEQDG